MKYNIKNLKMNYSVTTITKKFNHTLTKIIMLLKAFTLLVKN